MYEMSISACLGGPAGHKMYAKCTKNNRACGDYLLYHSIKYFKSVVLHEPCVLVRGCSNFINEPILTGGHTNCSECIIVGMVYVCC